MTSTSRNLTWPNIGTSENQKVLCKHVEKTDPRRRCSEIGENMSTGRDERFMHCRLCGLCCDWTSSTTETKAQQHRIGRKRAERTRIYAIKDDSTEPSLENEDKIVPSKHKFEQLFDSNCKIWKWNTRSLRARSISRGSEFALWAKTDSPKNFSNELLLLLFVDFNFPSSPSTQILCSSRDSVEFVFQTGGTAKCCCVFWPIENEIRGKLAMNVHQERRSL